MPDLEHDLLAALVKFNEHNAADGNASTRAMLERVIPFSRPGARIGAKSSFTSGVGYGRLTMALTAMLVPFDEVMPIKWQNAMSARTGGDKNISKARAAHLFPGIKMTHAIADALLIAEYGRRLHQGKL